MSTTDTSKLDDLIVTMIDSVKGYEHSAGMAHGAYAALFTKLAAERREAVALLQAHSSAIGGSPKDFGSEERRPCTAAGRIFASRSAAATR